MKIFLIGPGGVGKSTTGKILAQLLETSFIDLDQIFCDKIDLVGNFIDKNGYEKYCQKNSQLFFEIIKNQDNFVMALSSGFLVHEECPDLAKIHQDAIKEGISVLLLPSRSLKISQEIIIPRQLQRSFGLKAPREKEKLEKRFYRYQQFGDLQIFSKQAPEKIAQKIFKNIKYELQKH